MSGRKMTPKGQMAFGGGPPITHLPPAMKAMFQPGPPLIFRERPGKKRPPPYSGVSKYLGLFEDAKPPERTIHETPRDLREKRRKIRDAAHQVKLAEEVKKWDPHKPSSSVQAVTTKDAYKTLFVARLSYDTTEEKLRREFETYGPVSKVRVVQQRSKDDVLTGEADEDSKPRGYAFVEFEEEQDMRAAYKKADGRKVDGKRLLVDVERGRTVAKWRPRRLGGGLGTTRKAGGAPPPRVAPRPVARPYVGRPPPRRPRSRSRDRGGYDRRR